MSQQIEEIKEMAQDVQDGLKRMGASREVALSVHVTKDLVAELEEKMGLLAEKLDGLQGA